MSYSPLTPLDDRIAVVTGGARGIGFETARALRENGAKIVIVDINRELGEKAAKEFEGDYFAVDLTKPDQVAKLANDIVANTLASISHSTMRELPVTFPRRNAAAMTGSK